MDATTYTLDDVSLLLNIVVAGIRTGDNGDDRVYSLREVAERTGFALDTLEQECAADLIEHTRKGRRIGLTSRQIALLVTKHRRGTTAAAAAATSTSEQAAAHISTLRAASRRPSHGRNR